VQRRRPDPLSGPVGAPLLSVEGLLAAGIGPISFDVRPGEVMGIFGLVASGRTELLETLFGSRRAYSGRVILEAA
jgi:ribose transport system ATP-binding protein